ncbi:hypothetical protein [Sulfurirhabdus autotrophica]|uniref:Uncharacterized protein n=1 Tax=Sulfurirhabdus autotrophica TaxID=1706046 RepID=A0A4R3XSE6_9PROT|nr:hypothetical protein [Sulfurirhabdus autotrophica]TCV82565.1 hypothetical protein EDC63_12059 [Sulfurirhabdus autotrophica]
MATENDIFGKMNALLRKHQNSAPPPSMPQQPGLASQEDEPSFSESTKTLSALDIPVLTEVFIEDEPIPVLTDTLETDEMQSMEAAQIQELELDLDPYYTATFDTEPTDLQEDNSASLAFEAMDHPSLITEEISFTDFPEIESETPDLDTLPTELSRLFELQEKFEPHSEEDSPPLEHLNKDAEAEVEPEILQQIPEVTAQKSQAQISDSLTEEILRSIDRHLQKAMEKSVAPQLANSLDKALSSMLDQFSMHIEEMVKETIANELQKQLTAMLDVSIDADPAPTTPNNSGHANDSV